MVSLTCQEVAMLRGNALRGRAVIDLDAAERIGELAELVLDPSSQRVAGLVVSHRQAMVGAARQLVLPASAVHAVGPDAITIRRAAESALDLWQFSGLPRLSQITGRKVVSYSGKLLGSIDDVLIDGDDGRIIGYALGDARPLQHLERWLRGESRPARPDYVRADADLRVGPEMVMVPDDALVRGADLADDQAPALPSGSAGWSDFVLPPAEPEEWALPAPEPDVPLTGTVGSPTTPLLERTAPMRRVVQRDGRAD
jgi:sporulation protein YlmC with PRC-barrel domain